MTITTPTTTDRRRGPGRHWILAVAAVAAAGGLVFAACSDDPRRAAEGEESARARATAELRGAAAAMQQAGGFRFDATIASGGTTTRVVGHFEAPDRVHQVVTVAGHPTAEAVFIGRQAFVKDPATGTFRNRVQPPPAGTADPRAAFAALAQARGVSREGTTWRFSLPEQAARLLLQGPATGPGLAGDAHVEGGRLKTLAYRSSGPRPVEVSVTYSDVGTAPPVAEPAVA